MHIPTDWTFRSRDVASGFDQHVREQLPWYDLATGLVAHVGRHYIPDGGCVIDVGASTGNIGRALASIVESRNARMVAIDNAAEMAGVFSGPSSLIVADAREFDFAAYEPTFVVAFLVLMFVPPAERALVIRRMVTALRPGGAVLIVDKAEPRGGYLGTVMSRLALAAKYEAGATPDEVIRKELSLAGVQRPMADTEMVGFAPIFRFGDFAGWIFERPVA